MMHLSKPAFVSSAILSLRSRQSSWVCSQGRNGVVVQGHRTVLRNATPKRTSSHRVIAPCMSSPSTSEIATEKVGEENTFSFRLKYNDDNGPMSPWHDINIYPFDFEKQIVNFVNEIPKGGQAKMEIATDEEKNPVKQDVKKGELRFYKYGPSLVNYGAIPQTFEDPTKLNDELNVVGDGDPLDVTEVGMNVMPFGAVYKVKVLGCLALLDEGEIDWKVIAINIDDPLAAKVHDIEGLEKHMPGRISEIREWFRMYKTAEGKGENEYAYSGEAKGRDFAMSVVEETHQSWKDLLAGKIENKDDLKF